MTRGSASHFAAGFGAFAAYFFTSLHFFIPDELPAA
jgi:hypothetical protein